jgi:hypothetical protein
MALGMPNPQAGPQLGVSVLLSEGLAERITLVLYTKAMTRLQSIQIHGIFGNGWNHLTATWPEGCGAGLYYARIEACNDHGCAESSRAAKIMYFGR